MTGRVLEAPGAEAGGSPRAQHQPARVSHLPRGSPVNRWGEGQGHRQHRPQALCSSADPSCRLAGWPGAAYPRPCRGGVGHQGTPPHAHRGQTGHRAGLSLCRRESETAGQRRIQLSLCQGAAAWPGARQLSGPLSCLERLWVGAIAPSYRCGNKGSERLREGLKSHSKSAAEVGGSQALVRPCPAGPCGTRPPAALAAPLRSVCRQARHSEAMGVSLPLREGPAPPDGSLACLVSRGHTPPRLSQLWGREAMGPLD